ncbi:MAG: RsmE family RNA methyltransferase [Oligosphaeraceae bacterium]
MQIRRFFLPQSLNQPGATVSLPPAESQHALRVLRLEAGDRLQLLNGEGEKAECVLVSRGEGRSCREAVCRILSCRRFSRPVLSPVLLVAPPRGKAFDLVLKASVELGIRGIQPILCTYGVSRPEEVSEGWRETLTGALKQSGNPFLPALLPPLEFPQALLQYPPAETGVFGASPAAEATERRRLSPAAARGCRALWVGPEGGFSPEEEAALLQAGALPITLGESVLRVETAVPALMGCLQGIASLEEPAKI